MNVRVFGVRDRSTPGQDRTGDIEYGSHRFRLLNLGTSLDFGNADLVVLPALADLSPYDSEHASATELLVRRILRASESGARVCLFYSSDPQSTDFAGGQLLRAWRMKVVPSPAPFQHIHAPEFERYLDEYAVHGAVGTVFVRPAIVRLRFHPLAGPSEETEQLSAFAVAKGTGLIYLVPANLVAGSELALLSALADSIAAHSSAVLRPSTAAIVQSFVFTEEAKLRDVRQAKQAELEELDASLAGYESRKDILFLRDRALEERIPEWISTHLGIATRRIEEYKEDFWLLDGEGKDAAICETKALSQNVKRQHIRALALHRDQRDLPDDYPSLLVVNTFAEAETEEEKARQRVVALECSNAVKEHVLVARTVDLVRLLDQLERGLVSTQEIWELLLTATGWLKVQGDSREIVRA